MAIFTLLLTRWLKPAEEKQTKIQGRPIQTTKKPGEEEMGWERKQKNRKDKDKKEYGLKKDKREYGLKVQQHLMTP